MKQLGLMSLAVATMAANATESADRMDVSMLARGSFFSSSRTLDDHENVFGLTLEPKLDFKASDNSRFEFHARTGSYALGSGARSFSDSEIISAYWFYRRGKVDIRVGKQRISWGRADGVNPTDFFTPFDLTSYLPLEEDMRLTVPAARLDIDLTSGTLSVVAQPGFIPTKQPEPPNLDFEIRDRTDRSLSKARVGVRYSASSENLDWSVAAFRGYNVMPLFLPEGVDEATGTPVLSRLHIKVSALGFDLARNFGRYGFRTELAHIEPDLESTLQSPRPFYYLVSGIDRSIGDVNVNLQVVAHYTPDFKDPKAITDPLLQAVTLQNARTFGQSKRFEYGLTARLAYSLLNSTLQVELLSFANINTSNSLYRPLLKYAITDRSSMLLGAELYQGADDTLFGQLKRNQTVFIEYRYYTAF